MKKNETYKYKIEGSTESGLYYTMTFGSKAIVSSYQSVGWRAKLKIGDEVEATTNNGGIDYVKVVINGEVIFDKERGDKSQTDIIKANALQLRRNKFGLK